MAALGSLRKVGIPSSGVQRVKLSVTNLNHLNACWNSVYRRPFGFHRWESVRSFTNGLGRLNFHHIQLVLMAKFYKPLSHTENVWLKFTYEQLMQIDSNPLDVELIWHAPSVECAVPVYRLTASKGLTFIKK